MSGLWVNGRGGGRRWLQRCRRAGKRTRSQGQGAPQGRQPPQPHPRRQHRPPPSRARRRRSASGAGPRPRTARTATAARRSRRDAPGQLREHGRGIQGRPAVHTVGAELQKKRQADNSKDNPDALCLPMGFMQFHTHPQPRKMIQTPGLIVIIYEANYGLRQIFTDGRPCPTTIRSRGGTATRSASGRATRSSWRRRDSEKMGGSISGAVRSPRRRR